jgi:RHS repeat-associated protein
VLYTHDAWGRLVKVRHDLGSSTVHDVAEYEYNGLHWRTVRREDTNADGTLDQKRVGTYATSAGTDKRVQYFWGLRYIDDILMHRSYVTPPLGPPQGEDPPEEDEDTDDPPYAQPYGAFFHITDVQWSTVALLDSTGKLLERTRYQAYGQGVHRWPGDFNRDGTVDSADSAELVTPVKNAAAVGDADYEPDLDLDRSGAIDGTDQSLFGVWLGQTPVGAGKISNAAGPDNRVGYCGYLFNPNAAIYTVRHRHYEPVLGRFMEADPAGYVDGMNLYQYARGGSLHIQDPMGLWGEDWWHNVKEGWNALWGGEETAPDQEWKMRNFRQEDCLKAQADKAYKNGKITKEEHEWIVGQIEENRSNAIVGLREIRDLERGLKVAVHLSTVLPAIGVRAAVTVAQGARAAGAIARGSNIFYTGGREALEYATSLASRTGGRLVSNTSWGNLAQAQGTQRAWEQASFMFAQETRGVAHVVLRIGNSRAESIFWTIEHPILVRNNIELIWHIIP